MLDLDKPMKPRSFLLASNGRQGDRLVVDLVPVGTPAKVRKAPVVTANRVTGRDIVVAIDAGHGGKDPGARGPTGVREKDVVLKISRRLAEIIEADPNMRAYLTRSNDRFVNLRERMERSRAADADLFISIHADAFSDRRVRGATVYVLSSKGASDEAARRLAERENAKLGAVELDDKDPTLAGVLMDLSQNAALSASFDVGDEILQEIGQITKVRKRRVQQAPFLVLKSPDVPSILVETAFIRTGPTRRTSRARIIVTGWRGRSSPASRTISRRIRRRNAVGCDPATEAGAGARIRTRHSPRRDAERDRESLPRLGPPNPVRQQPAERQDRRRQGSQDSCHSGHLGRVSPDRRYRVPTARAAQPVKKFFRFSQNEKIFSVCTASMKSASAPVSDRYGAVSICSVDLLPNGNLEESRDGDSAAPPAVDQPDRGRRGRRAAGVGRQGTAREQPGRRGEPHRTRRGAGRGPAVPRA